MTGSYLLARLSELLEYPIVGDVRGLGMMVGFELVQDKVTKRPFAPTQWMSQQLATTAMEQGLIVYPLIGAVDGQAGDMIKLSPPLTTTQAQADEIVTILHASLASIQANLVS